MVTLYRKDGSHCNADADQVEAMKRTGWKRKKPKGWDKAAGNDAPAEEVLPANRIRQIVDAIKQIGTDNPGLLMADGETPLITSIERILKFDITTAERNTALDTIKAEADADPNADSGVVTGDDDE